MNEQPTFKPGQRDLMEQRRRGKNIIFETCAAKLSVSATARTPTSKRLKRTAQSP